MTANKPSQQPNPSWRAPLAGGATRPSRFLGHKGHFSKLIFACTFLGTASRQASNQPTNQPLTNQPTHPSCTVLFAPSKLGSETPKLVGDQDPFFCDQPINQQESLFVGIL